MFALLGVLFPTKRLRSFPRRRIWELAQLLGIKVKQWSKALKYTLNSFKSQGDVLPLIVSRKEKKEKKNQKKKNLIYCSLTKENKYFVHIILHLFLQNLLL